MNRFLLACLAVAVLAGTAWGEKPTLDTRGADKLGWQLAVHAYTFRMYPITEAIDKTAGLGLRHFSLSGGTNADGKNVVRTHLLADDVLAAIHGRLDAAGMKLVNIGVVQLPPDESASRKVFDFAKKHGVGVLVAEPEAEAMDTVEKLVEEYHIQVAIHNHPGPNNRYWHPDKVLDAIRNRSNLIGVCADTGHWVRSGLDPVECLKKVEGRIICLHFKDLSEKGPKAQDAPWGTGAANAKGQMEELKRQGFRGVFGIEYEHYSEKMLDEMGECVRFFYRVAGELAGN
jgi:sugar phosphate isomerase/epimerase